MVTREDGRQIVEDLVKKYKMNHDEYVQATYTEAQLRSDFLNLFFSAFGWDIFNERNLLQHLREVILEQPIEVTELGTTRKKRPDYAFRFGKERKFFVEAKKPSINIIEDKPSTFQLRRYGWNARLGASILTNFEHFIIYDCRCLPESNDNTIIARLNVYGYNDYLDNFDDIYDVFSRDAVYNGIFDNQFNSEINRVGTNQFDHYFLEQIENWRIILAQDFFNLNPKLNEEELNSLVQQLINRIIFLRICEDRDLEKYESLKAVNTYDALKSMFRKADERYDSGLFNFLEDKLSLNIEVSSEVLINIFKELYYPKGPYDFSVVEASLLGEIYELFLAREIHINEEGNVDIIDKPEVVESSGIVPTPKYIVEEITERTLMPLYQGKSPNELSQLHVLDMACGSGIFLLSAYELLLNYHLEWYVNDGTDKHLEDIFQVANEEWYLTLHRKQQILINNIFGVDIDIEAVEVARFSLLIRVLEGESSDAITAHLTKHKIRALPNLEDNIQCGNSLVDSQYYAYDKEMLITERELKRLNVFDWYTSFAMLTKERGFDVIIGNPPYIRIQNMVKYWPQEIEYYRSEISPYICAKADNYDKYSLFIERALSLLKPNGRLGYIVPNKFFTIKSGKALRKLISTGSNLVEIVDFGVQQIFKKRSTYTCILIMSKNSEAQFTVEHVLDIETWRYGKRTVVDKYYANDVNEEPWIFISEYIRAIFNRLVKENSTIGMLADVAVGIQTSADKIYIIKSISESPDLLKFVDVNGSLITIEKSILRPCLLDVPLEGFGKTHHNAYVIFPYWIMGRKATLYTKDEMELQFPYCWNYLNIHKSQLMTRSINKISEANWYQHGRNQRLWIYNGEPKLIWPVLSVEPRYSYDDENTTITGGGNGPYYSLRPKDETQVSIYYIQAVLSHPLTEAILRQRTSNFRGGYYSHGKQFIEKLPIPDIDFNNPLESDLHDRISTLVQELIRNTEKKTAATIVHNRNLWHRRCKSLKSEIDILINQLFGLDEQDLKAFETLTQVENELAESD